MIEDFGEIGKSLLIDIWISDAVNWSYWIDSNSIKNPGSAKSTIVASPIR
jgi:hypothetical protein